ncbi:MAG: hypothetical protein ACO1SV_21800 [Fimbriimonas sp.]
MLWRRRPSRDDHDLLRARVAACELVQTMLLTKLVRDDLDPERALSDLERHCEVLAEVQEAGFTHVDSPLYRDAVRLALRGAIENLRAAFPRA